MGFRACGILPADPARYTIFGEPLYTPCAGQVIAAVDGVEDMPPPQMDRQHMAGNYVILNCEATWVLLGHLPRAKMLSMQVGAMTH